MRLRSSRDFSSVLVKEVKDFKVTPPAKNDLSSSLLPKELSPPPSPQFTPWKYLCPRKQLNLRLTFLSGQVFCWREVETDEGGEAWTGVIGATVYQLREKNCLANEHDLRGLLRGEKGGEEDLRSLHHGSIEYRQFPESCPPTPLFHFLHLHIDFHDLYEQWSVRDKTRFFEVSRREELQGLRILNQDPTECIFSFIVSANNHVKRIAKILEDVRARFGTRLAEVDGKSFFSWPALSVLSSVPPIELRGIGMGYRAEYFVKTAIKILKIREGGREREEEEGNSKDITPVQTRRTQKKAPKTEVLGLLSPEDILTFPYSLKSPTIPTETARVCLESLPGIGRKVADCVLLFSMDRPEVVPCDRHVLRIAEKYYGLPVPPSLTLSHHLAINKKFFDVFGERCGWAHSVLFAAELQEFKVEGEKKRKGNGEWKKEERV